MNDTNIWCGSGRLTKDPELRNTPTGVAVCELSLACNGSRGRGTDRKEVVSYFDIIVFGKTGEACNEHLRKGSPIFCEGRLEQQRWADKDGKNRSKVVVLAQRLQFLGRSTTEESPSRERETSGNGGASGDGPVSSGEPFGKDAKHIPPKQGRQQYAEPPPPDRTPERHDEGDDNLPF